MPQIDMVWQSAPLEARLIKNIIVSSNKVLLQNIKDRITDNDN